MKPGKTMQVIGLKSPPPLILHVPHASTRIPFTDGYLNEESTNQEIQLLTDWYTEQHGYSLGIDWPYAGTILPTQAYKSNAYVHSIMLEVNRKLYLQPNHSAKNNGFDQIKTVIQDWLSLIHSN
jgi:N-formylglutamate amidohydrolase